ncbi:MAG: signal peptidase I [Anaerolineales bacterium]|nr:signal peptidase I [Anaerolineales bacterium]
MEVLETLILAMILFLAINVISARVRVDGMSMEPSLHDGQFVIVNRLAYRFGSPQRGDVVVFHYPQKPEQEYIKRVIGLPGDSIEIRSGSVYVNGERLDEPYVSAITAYQGQWTVSDGHLFVLGDNRNASFDSHNWGTVPLEYTIGQALIVYWPPADWGMVEHILSASAAPGVEK